MNNNDLIKGLKVLRSGHPGSIEADGGHFACVRFSGNIESEVIEILSDFFHCELVSSTELLMIIVANNQLPILYEMSEVAMLNAASYYSGLEKKYIFQCYRAYGVKLDVPQESVINFISRAKK
jgi:hypothetical protein